MGLIKCPRCELNYIEESEGFCKICKREMKGEKQQEEIELCTICNEQPALPGKDVCLFCLQEMNNSDEDLSDEETPKSLDKVDIGIDPMSSMDEIIPEVDEDIPSSEYNEIENEMSLDQMGEEEAMDDENEEEDDN